MAKKKVTQKTPRISAGNVFIDLTWNHAFHLIFSKRGNEDLLIKLVRAVLPQLNVTSVSLSNQEEVGTRKEARKAVMDVHCTTANVHYVTVELPKMKKDYLNGEIKDDLILYAIRDIGAMTEMPEIFRAAGLEKLFSLPT